MAVAELGKKTSWSPFWMFSPVRGPVKIEDNFRKGMIEKGNGVNKNFCDLQSELLSDSCHFVLQTSQKTRTIQPFEWKKWPP